MNKLEEEYKKYEKELQELDSETEDKFHAEHDSLSSAICDCCGKRLSVDEWEEWESMCEECMWEATSGLIDDTNEEL